MFKSFVVPLWSTLTLAKKSLHTPNGQRRFGAAPHSVLSRLVAPTRKSSLKPTRPRRCCPSTWPSELQTKSGLETRLWRGDCTVPQKSTKIRTCAQNVANAEPIKSGWYEQKEIRCAQGGGGEVAAWGRTGHAARTQCTPKLNSGPPLLEPPRRPPSRTYL